MVLRTANRSGKVAPCPGAGPAARMARCVGVGPRLVLGLQRQRHRGVATGLQPEAEADQRVREQEADDEQQPYATELVPHGSPHSDPEV